MPPTERSMVDFDRVDRALRHILQPYRSRLVASKDGPDGLVLEIPGLEGKPGATSPASGAANGT